MPRISVRFDEQDMLVLNTLKDRFKCSKTDVLKRALIELHRKEFEDNEQKIQKLFTSDFIACSVADKDLSSQFRLHVNKKAM